MNAGPCHPRPVLVLDGALAPAGAALVRQGRVVGSETVPAARRARSDLFDAASRLLAQERTSPGALAGVVVGTGPGSFTGLRVGLSVVRGLALARPDLPVVGVDAPRALAAAGGVQLPARVAIPWGRLRLLLATARVEGPRPQEARLVARAELAGCRELVGETIVAPPALADAVWPPGVRVQWAEQPPFEAVAALVAAGRIVPARPGVPEPSYLVPADAVLPERPGRLPAGFRHVRLGPGDLGELVELERRAFSDPWSPRLLADELVDASDRRALGVRDPAGRLVGAALARIAADEMNILSVETTPEVRRRGIGRALVRALLGQARMAGCWRVDLEVRVHNQPAIALYAAEGFVPVGRRRRYYRDGTDALLMSLVLRRAGTA